MPVLDSNFLILISHDDAQATRALRQIAEEHLVVPAQAAAEFLVGVADMAAELQAIHESFELAHTDDEHLLAMASLRAELRAKAIRPRWGDIHIAAQAQIHQTYVVTSNARHFRPMGIPTWNWLKERQPPPAR